MNHARASHRSPPPSFSLSLVLFCSTVFFFRSLSLSLLFSPFLSSFSLFLAFSLVLSRVRALSARVSGTLTASRAMSPSLPVCPQHNPCTPPHAHEPTSVYTSALELTSARAHMPSQARGVLHTSDGRLQHEARRPCRGQPPQVPGERLGGKPANRPPLFYATPLHHVKRAYSTTDGVNTT